MRSRYLSRKLIYNLQGMCQTGAATLAIIVQANSLADSAKELPLATHNVFEITPRTYYVSTPFPRESLLGEGKLKVNVYDLPVKNSVPSILDIDSSGRIWFLMGGGGFAGITYPSLSFVGRMELPGKLTVFQLPTEHALPSGLKAFDNKIYITEYKAGRIAIVDPEKATVTETLLPDADARPTALDTDSRGNLWFNENNGNRIGRLSKHGILNEMQIPTPQSRPTGMVVGRDDTVWFAQMSGNKIARLTHAGVLTEFMVPTAQSRPTAMLETKDGRIWFSERTGNKIGVIERDVIKEYVIPWKDTGPFFLIEGSDDAIWFTQLYSSAIGRFDLKTQTFSRMLLPFEGRWPAGLQFDDNGRLWVALQQSNKIAVLEQEIAK